MTEDALRAEHSVDSARGRLVRRCLELGLTVEEIQDAGDDLLDRAVQRILSGGRDSLTIAQVAERTSAPLSEVTRIAKAIGIDDTSSEACPFNEGDVALVENLRMAFDVMGEDAVLQFVRVSAAAAGRIADAAMSTFLTTIGAPASRDESGLELLDANMAAVGLLEKFGELMTQMLLHYLSRSYRPRSDVSVHAVLAAGVDTRRLAIGFADLVGSTEIGNQRSLAELNHSLDVFERTSTELVTALGGRVVKFIGDEVMYRADTADVACMIATALTDFAQGEPDLPPLRAGVAIGEVLSRDGDFYGPTVNLASRITKFAPPHGVTVTAETIDALSSKNDFVVGHLGEIEVRGMLQPVELSVLWSLDR